MMSRGVVWRRRLLGAIASGILVSIGATSALAADVAPAAVAQKVENHNALWSKLSAEPGARLPVIVRFDMPSMPQAAAFASPQAADDAQTKAIRAVQEKILGAVLPAGTLSSASASDEKNIKLMDFSPMFGIVASADDLARFAADPNVTMIQEDTLDRPYLAQSLPLIQMPAMYSAGAAGNNYRVAVLDTGGRRGHVFLSSRIISEACYNTSGVQGSSSRCPGGASSSIATGSGEDCTASNIYGCGHGTHVAGTAAGFNTTGSGPANGVARDARIISINVFSQFPANSSTPCGSMPGYTHCVLTFTSDQIRGLERVYALRGSMNIAAVNMSLGGGAFSSHCDSDSRKPIIDQLRAANIATVIAAGNDGLNTQVGAPGCISSAVTVGSTTKSDFRSGFSNWGSLVDIAAPGSDINASYISGSSNTHFQQLSGTSMASPHVAGAWAALRSARPTATVPQILAALQNTGTNIASAGTTIKRINVNSARIALGGGTPPPTGPANDNFVNRTLVAPPAQDTVRTTTGTNVGSTAEAGEPNHAGVSGARTSVWWRYTPATSGTITIDTLGSGFDTVLAVYRGSSVGALTPVAANDDAQSPQRWSRVTFSGVAGTQYQIAVAGYGNATGAITLNVQGGSPVPRPPANDNFSARVMIPPHGAIFGPRAVTANNTYATHQVGEPLHFNRPVATRSVWWRYTPATSGRITIDTNGSNFNTVLAVYTGPNVRNLRQVVWNDDDPALGRRSRVIFDGTAGVQYQIAVAGGYGNNYGHIRMTIRGGGRYVVSGAGQVAGVSSLATPHHQAMQAAAPANAGLFAVPAANGGQPAADTASQANTLAGLPAKGQTIGLGAGSAASKADGKLPVGTAASATAPVELLSTVVTASDDGVLRIPADGSGFAIVAVNNLGARATLQASLSTEGSAATPASSRLSICRTNSETGECLGARGATVTFTAEPGELVTFAVHAAGVGAAIPLDLSANRLHVHFRQGATTVGTASMPVCTAGAAGCDTADSAKQSAELLIAR
jgi:subtilisin family serine protease